MRLRNNPGYNPVIQLSNSISGKVTQKIIHKNPTLDADTLILMAFIPGLQLTSLTAVEHFMAAATGCQSHPYRTTALVTVLKQWFPKIHT